MIDNNEDIIDSRDVIERLAELAGQWADHANGEGEPLTDEEKAEMLSLQELTRQGEDLSDWQYGEVLIRDSYFEDYARELAEDIGAIDPNASWPLTYLDWEAAADALKMDYTSLDFDGVTYWAR